MRFLRFTAVKGSRSIAAAAFLCLLVAGALVTDGGSPLAFGSSPRADLAAARFDPRSVTFVSTDTGWALGTVRCASSACLALRETTDAGRSWSERSLPRSLVAAADRKVGGVEGAPGLSVRFADQMNGWIYGSLAVPVRRSGMSSVALEATLWSTHDGGLVWRRQPLRGLGYRDSIFDVEAANGTVYLMETNTKAGVTVKSSPVAEDSWHVSNVARLGSPAGGGEQAGAFVLQGSSGWLVEGNDRGTTGSAELDAEGRWVSWTPPCASVGHSFAIPAASTSHNLVAVCVMGGFAYPLSKSSPHGATLGSSWLYFSNDGGSTFHAGPELSSRAYEVYGLVASPSPGVILVSHGAGGDEDLQASFDGGAHWSVVYRGELLSLAFTSPGQGVGIVQSADGASTMIMTFDGGHRWAPVSF